MVCSRLSDVAEPDNGWCAASQRVRVDAEAHFMAQDAYRESTSTKYMAQDAYRESASSTKYIAQEAYRESTSKRWGRVPSPTAAAAVPAVPASPAASISFRSPAPHMLRPPSGASALQLHPDVHDGHTHSVLLW